MRQLFARIRGHYRLVRERMLRVVCRRLLSLSTFQARRHLKRAGAFSILIDNSVLGHGVTHETAWISTGTKKWGPHDIDTGYAARIPVHSPRNDSRTYREVRFLAGIAALAKQGYLTVYTSGELQAERFRQPAGRFTGYGYYDLNLFSGVNMNRVGRMHLDLDGDPKECQLRRVNSCTDPLFRSLLALLGPANSLDAFHIFTAEQHGISCFLHMDFRLGELVRQNRNKAPFTKLKTQILTPSELGAKLGLLPVDTNILTYEGTSFPARPDLYWDKQRRRSPRRDRKEAR